MQWPVQAGSLLQLHGPTLDGAPFDLGSQRGKVVLVVFWHTGCAVCLDKMPELRANAAGWAGQRFSLVTVQTDEREQAARDYWRLVGSTQAGRRDAVRWPVLWRGQAGYVDNLSGTPARWPLSILVGADGRELQRWEGRMPAEAWDRIADEMAGLTP